LGYHGLFSSLQQKFDFTKQTAGSIGKILRITEEGGREVEMIKYDQGDVNYLRYAYDEGIKYVDEQLKDFFDQIKSLPDFENTVIIISAEQGMDLKEHGFIFHRDLYDTNIHVPLIILAPKCRTQKIEKSVSSSDIMQTIIDLAGIPMPENIGGKSLLPLIKSLSLKESPI